MRKTMVARLLAVLLLAVSAFAFEKADPQTLVGSWRADLSKSTMETGPVPDSLVVDISLSEDQLILNQVQTLGARIIKRSQQLPLVDQEATVHLPQGIEERWRTESEDSRNIKCTARVVQQESEIGFRFIVMQLSADGDSLTLEYQIDSGRNGRFADHLTLTRVRDKK